MLPYDKLTIIRNRWRARDLRIFRDLVEAYFEGAEYAADDLPIDWEATRKARAQINRMLPRVLEIMYAARLGVPQSDGTYSAPAAANVKVVRNIFRGPYQEGTEQEILDVVDMAIGIHDASWISALIRTVNPLHYAATLLTFVAKIPGRAFSAIFHLPRHSGAQMLREIGVDRLEAVVSRLGNLEELIEAGFADVRDRQSRQYVESADQLADLADRLDFAERMIAEQSPSPRLQPHGENGVATPV